MKKSRRRSKITTRVQFLNISILIVILIITIVAAMLMASSISNRSSEKLAYFYSLESVEKFNSYIVRDFTIVQKTAGSEAVKAWFADEFNDEKKFAAYKEVMEYVDSLALSQKYFGIDSSLNEYSVAPGTLYSSFIPISKLNRYDPDNLWYYDLLDRKSTR
jgi:hypothetical protein